MILIVTTLHIAHNQTLSPTVRVLAVWTPMATVALAPPMDNVIGLQRTALLRTTPQVNDPD